MKFDFNEIIERSGKDAIAIDGIGKAQLALKSPRKVLILSLCGLPI